MSKKTIYLDDAIDAVGSMLRRKFGIGGDLAEITLAGLPSAQPEREKGKWIWKTGDVYKCSECGSETHVDEYFGEPIYNYCPYCNAFMDGYER